MTGTTVINKTAATQTTCRPGIIETIMVRTSGSVEDAEPLMLRTCAASLLASAGLLLVTSGQYVPRMGMDHIVRASACGKWVRQIVINVPTIRAKRQRDLEP